MLLKIKGASIFKADTPNQIMYGRGKKLSKPKIHKQEDDNYEPIRVGIFWNINYIEYESNHDRNKNLSLKEYLDQIKPYLRDVIIYLHDSDIWEIQLAIAINFISSKDVEENCVMHSKCNNIKFTLYNDGNEVIVEFFKTLLSRYQGNFETSIRGSNFIFDSVQTMYYKCHKVNFRRVGSYIDSGNWIKKQNAKTNSKNKDVFNMW